MSTSINKYIGPVPYPMNDINSNFKVYNPKTGLNEPVPNIIKNDESEESKNEEAKQQL